MIVKNILQVKVQNIAQNNVKWSNNVTFKGDIFTRSVKKIQGESVISSLTKEMEECINSLIPNACFKYPQNYAIYDKSDMLKISKWYFPKGKKFIKEQLEYLKQQFNEYNLVPFAMNEEATEYACFVIDGKSNNKIRTVYPFGSKEDFYQEEYIDINDWIKNGI